MEKRLDHLPEGKKRELEFVVGVIRDGFAKAIAHRTQPRFRTGKVLKIILFGSYARGDWVDDPIGRYHSDYDLLVVVDHEDLTDVPELWAKTEDRLLDELSAGKVLRTPVSVIYHSLEDVNEKLELGRYFFMDIVREGIVLHEEPGYPFAEPRPLSPKEALGETQEYYEEWFGSAGEFLDDFRSFTRPPPMSRWRWTRWPGIRPMRSTTMSSGATSSASSRWSFDGLRMIGKA